MIVVLTTLPTEEEGGALAEKIVGEHLAACVQILPRMTSIYHWEGTVQRETEHLLLIKTLDEKFAELEKFIKANHSYEVPEIVAFKAAEVSEPYARWLADYLQ